MRRSVKVKLAYVWVFLAAARAVAQTGPPDAGWGADRLAAALHGGDTAVAVEAAQALAELRDNAVAFRALADALENSKLNVSVRRAALRALTAYGDARAAETFMAVFGDEEVRWSSADALIHFKSEAVTARLIGILREDKKARRRATAAYALGRFREAAAFPPLLEALRDDKAEVRTRACAAAAAYGDAAAVEPLLANLATDNDRLGRLAAAEALGAVPDDRSVKPLCEALDDKHDALRVAAAQSLAAIGDMRAMDPLRARLQREKNKEVRAAIDQALTDLKAAVLSEVKP